MSTIELGLDTFGDIPTDDRGERLSYGGAIRQVVEGGRPRRPPAAMPARDPPLGNPSRVSSVVADCNVSKEEAVLDRARPVDPIQAVGATPDACTLGNRRMHDVSCCSHERCH